jgi:hypothetical protein
MPHFATTWSKSSGRGNNGGGQTPAFLHRTNKWDEEMIARTKNFGVEQAWEFKPDLFHPMEMGNSIHSVLHPDYLVHAVLGCFGTKAVDEFGRIIKRGYSINIRPVWVGTDGVLLKDVVRVRGGNVDVCCKCDYNGKNLRFREKGGSDWETEGKEINAHLVSLRKVLADKAFIKSFWVEAQKEYIAEIVKIREEVLGKIIADINNAEALLVGSKKRKRAEKC